MSDWWRVRESLLLSRERALFLLPGFLEINFTKFETIFFVHTLNTAGPHVDSMSDDSKG
jgi:hypothetical protein